MIRNIYGVYCKKFREENNLTLNDVITVTNINCKIGTISSFEMGRSSNIDHLTTYILLSNTLGLGYSFMSNLYYEVCNNDN